MNDFNTNRIESPKLRKSLFWDTDIEKIDWEVHKREVISRTIMYGNLNEWREIKRFYGLDIIKTEMLSVRYLDNKTLHFLSTFFQIPKEKFRCYIWKQSIPAQWTY